MSTIHLWRINQMHGMSSALCGELVPTAQNRFSAAAFVTCVPCLIEQLRASQNLATGCLVRLAELEHLGKVVTKTVVVARPTAVRDYAAGGTVAKIGDIVTYYYAPDRWPGPPMTMDARVKVVHDDGTLTLLLLNDSDDHAKLRAALGGDSAGRLPWEEDGFYLRERVPMCGATPTPGTWTTLEKARP
jgi:hypothetical protein